MDRTDLVKPTAEMLRHKQASGGGEINDPLSYLDLTDIQKQALSLYFGLAISAGFGSQLKISSLNKRIGGTNTTTPPDDDRDIKAKLRYEEAREALSLAGIWHMSVVDMVRGYQGEIEVTPQFLETLRTGADTLAKHFKITN